MSTPLSVIGGFLGAGKTTLLNHVLEHARGVRYAVLVNDFGEVAVDDRLVVDHGGDTVSFANGCLCCSLGDNLLDTVDRLLAMPRPPEQFLVEASGVADPTAIADLATLHPDLRRDLVIVLCDAATVRERALDARLADTVERQLAAADVLVLNHCDRVGQQAREETLAWLGERSGRCVVATTRARIGLEVLDASQRSAPRRGAAAVPPAHPAHPFHTRVVHGLAPQDTRALRERLISLGPSVLRAKGLLREAGASGGWRLVQMVGKQVEVTPMAPGEVRGHESALVLLSVDPLPGASTLAARLGLVRDPAQD